MDEERLRSWEEFDDKDPDIWTVHPSEWDTSDLESEIAKLKEDADYKKKLWRDPVPEEFESDEAVIDATAVLKDYE